MMNKNTVESQRGVETNLMQSRQSDILNQNTENSKNVSTTKPNTYVHTNDIFMDLESFLDIENEVEDDMAETAYEEYTEVSYSEPDNDNNYTADIKTEDDILQDIAIDTTGEEAVETDINTDSITQEHATVSVPIVEEAESTEVVTEKAKENNSKPKSSSRYKFNMETAISLTEQAKEKITSIDKKTVINTIDNAIVSSAKLTKKLSESSSDNGSFKTDICQNFIPIKDIIGNMLLTADNRYVQILEILPINFYDKSPHIADNIVHNFAKLFYSGQITHQFKVVCDKSNPQKLIEFIRSKNKKEKNPKVLAQAEDTIQTIRNIAENGGLSKRFFIIFEYEGENGKRSSDVEEIYETMNHTRFQIIQAFNSMGNYVKEPEYRKEAMFYSEILYYHFNKRTCRTENVSERIERMNNDKEIYNSVTGENKEITLNDACSPKGIDLRYKTFCKMDGSYYTYLTLTDESYIQLVYAGWLDLFTKNDGFELDVFIKRLPKEITDMYMSQKIKFKRVSVRRARIKNQDKYEELSKELNDDYYIKGMLASGDSLYNVCSVITIRAESYKSLMQKRKLFTRQLKKDGILFEEAYCNIEDYVLMTMPLLMYDKAIFNRNSHNFTTSQLASLYMFTAYELYDTNGFILGLNERNDTIASLNQFNTQMYRNANMLILGTSGAGKSFTEMCLGWRMRVAGIRVFYVLPVKGYEYQKMCDLIGGQYIKLAPSLKNCINFLEVRPETAIDKSALEEGVVFENTSWLSKTMVFATTFISLFLRRDLTPKENTKLNIAMRAMYRDFGITDDNNSVFVDGTKTLKQMPIPTDLLVRLENDPAMEEIVDVLEEFRSGSLQNFNQQTNVDLSNAFTVFDVDENDMGERFLPAFLYLAINIVYSICKSNRLSYKAIILDEVWKALVNDGSAKQIQMLVKLVRGYGASAILATQDIKDFADTKFGSSVISNTQIKFILKLEESELKEVTKYMTLEEKDITDILGFERGHGMLIANNDKTKIHIIPSQKEISAFTTDTNILRKLANVDD